MSASCDLCKNVERLERVRDRHQSYLKELVGVHEKVWAVRDSWFRRLLAGVSLSESIALVDTANDAIKAAQEALDAAQEDLERAEDRIPGAAVEKAARAIAADIEKDIFAETDREFLGFPSIKGLAEKLDADLKFEDKVKEAKLEDISAPKRDHSVHQGAHYVGDTCPLQRSINNQALSESSDEPKLSDLYSQLPTPELKVHYEAALDAFVSRGLGKKRAMKFTTKKGK